MYLQFSILTERGFVFIRLQIREKKRGRTIIGVLKRTEKPPYCRNQRSRNNRKTGFMESSSSEGRWINPLAPVELFFEGGHQQGTFMVCYHLILNTAQPLSEEKIQQTLLHLCRFVCGSWQWYFSGILIRYRLLFRYFVPSHSVLFIFPLSFMLNVSI